MNTKLLAKKKKITVAKKSGTATKAGKLKLKLKPKKAAKKVLKRKRKLKATVKVTFTPKGGTAKSTKRKVTFKLKKKSKKSRCVDSERPCRPRPMQEKSASASSARGSATSRACRGCSTPPSTSRA